jgi:hypothetical protein
MALASGGRLQFWTRFAKPAQLNRLFLLAAVAVALWTAAGAVDRRRRCGPPPALWTAAGAVDRRRRCGPPPALWTAAGALALRRDPGLCLFSAARGARRSLVHIGRVETALLSQLLDAALRQIQSLLLPTPTRNFGWLT